jgi:dihydrofolate reductase
MIKAIVAVDNNWSIGIDGGLLTHLPKDLQRFKRITDGNFIIMGRKTLESLPGGKPLPNRFSIILTRDPNYKNEEVVVVHSIPQLLSKIEALKKMFPALGFFICGGGQIYKQLLPYTQQILVTKINHEFEGTDTKFENLDKAKGWKVIESEIEIEDNGYLTDYITYERG